MYVYVYVRTCIMVQVLRIIVVLGLCSCRFSPSLPPNGLGQRTESLLRGGD